MGPTVMNDPSVAELERIAKAAESHGAWGIVARIFVVGSCAQGQHLALRAEDILSGLQNKPTYLRQRFLPKPAHLNPGDVLGHLSAPAGSRGPKGDPLGDGLYILEKPR